LGHEGIFWLLSRIEEVASSANNKGFFQKIRTAYNVIICQRCYNVHGAYLAIEEGGGGLFCSLKVVRNGVGVAL